MNLTDQERFDLEEAVAAAIALLWEEVRAIVGDEIERQARRAEINAGTATASGGDQIDAIPFDPTAIPAATWSDIEARTADKLSDELAAIYLLSFTAQSRELLADDEDATAKAAAIAASKFAETQAAALSAEITANTVAALAAISLTAAITQQSAIQAELDKVLGANRASAIGVTETTSTLSRGQMDAGDRYEKITGGKLQRLWVIEDGTACKVCRAVNDEPEEVWGAQFPGGPPAHPHCRCKLKLVPTGMIYSIGGTV